jgi:hypothetical protein
MQELEILMPWTWIRVRLARGSNRVGVGLHISGQILVWVALVGELVIDPSLELTGLIVKHSWIRSADMGLASYGNQRSSCVCKYGEKSYPFGVP